MSDYYSLDELCEPVNYGKKGLTMRFNHLTQTLGCLVVAGAIIGGFILYKSGASVMDMLNGDDISTTAKNKDEQVIIGQFLRYCKPSLRQRFGNGYDPATCREKLKSLAAYEAPKEPQNLASMPDVDAEIEANDRQFRARFGNISKVESSMH